MSIKMKCKNCGMEYVYDTANGNRCKNCSSPLLAAVQEDIAGRRMQMAQQLTGDGDQWLKKCEFDKA